ncbi:hypothetical protein AXF42_Ash020254 [Apostasia shenzhenica]|uniref:CHHC U11-48K-type domain-containing protein n=1 Tax=Apostasia shenzhenica TaxID=1088818 RepID=A0A2I0AVS8_9ASPA|nr:hypothetical protein AXF42_Ash020254 [Apostasia shenzhenica]
MDGLRSSPESSISLPLSHSTAHVIPDQISSDLTATISLLQNLTSLAESTLKSVSDCLSSCPTSSHEGCLACCPFDSRHRMLPEFLFRHSLTCRSAPGSPLLDLGFLDSIGYTKSLKSADQLSKEKLFVQHLPEVEGDLCFSLDGELGDIDSNFFYKDCPGVVTTSESGASCRTFTLPAILSTECANFINGRGEAGAGLGQRIGILPSDFLSSKFEVESWSDYPLSYSYAVLLVAVELTSADERILKRWIILNSPLFGILIDVALRDHIFLILKLCLKAITREAICSLKLTLEKKEFLDPRGVSFQCPCLLGSLTWLSSQMSVLYGEVSGKCFVLGMLKESFLLAGRSSMCFDKEIKSSVNKVVCDSESKGKDCKSVPVNSVENLDVQVHRPSEESHSNQVFVSQVAAAIAALHERVLLEQRVKGLRFSQPLPKSQLFMKLFTAYVKVTAISGGVSDYLFTSVRASEERAKRPNYRPILEHDGLLWQRPNNQEFDKTKTREELLAEERDYKRRRMSYRGKKVKRSPLQVLHDIIEEHMEEIKQAGGIGCNVKVASDSVLFPKIHSDSINDSEFRSSKNYATDTRISKSLHSSSNMAAKAHEEYSVNNESSFNHSSQKSHYERLEHKDGFKKKKLEIDESCRFRSLSFSDDTCSGEGYPQKDQKSFREKRDSRGLDYSSRHSSHRSRFSLIPNSQELTKYEHNYSRRPRVRHGRTAHESFDSTGYDVFEDRYDPSCTYDGGDDFYENISVGSNYVRSEKHYSRGSFSEDHVLTNQASGMFSTAVSTCVSSSNLGEHGAWLGKIWFLGNEEMRQLETAVELCRGKELLSKAVRVYSMQFRASDKESHWNSLSS